MNVRLQPTSRAMLAGGKRRDRIADSLTRHVLPLGLFALLTGMFWSGDRTLYNQLYYVLLALPALVLVVLRPPLLRELVSSRIVLPFLVFSAFTLISISWSGTDDNLASLLKRPLYITLLIVAAIAVQQTQPQRVRQIFIASMATAVVAGAVSLIVFLQGNEPRLLGYGALFNPLLTSHVYGFFLAMAIAALLCAREGFAIALVVATLVLAAVILATGSRTPLLGIGATMLWLAVLAGGRRGLIALAITAVAALFIVTLFPDLLGSRGLSYRPEIWREAVHQIAEHPLLGHGFDHPMEILVQGLDLAIRDPHNMILAVLYYEGVVGLVLWLWLYGAALVTCWRQRHDAAVLICSATLIYGLAASMTEGGAFLARPREHWFLIWIPFALLAAASSRGKHAAVRTR